MWRKCALMPLLLVGLVGPQGAAAQAVVPTATVPPTPYPCFVDEDCPLGQVCGPDKLCQPAPTPTPTIACPDQTCPDGLTCVSGICRDLSTPTPTPTPLPMCITDQDCVNLEGSGFHCRASVCVPIRLCDDTNPNIDRKSCRGAGETCVDNECECGGDCNLDGYVFGNEITQMICVLNEQCQLSTTCPAGDFNGDGAITGDEVCQAVTNLGSGCPAGGLDPPTGIEIRSLDIGSATGAPGDSVTIPISLSIPGDTNPADGDVATAQLDLIFDTTVLDIPDPASACTVDPRVQATDATFTFLPQTPNTPAGMARLRLFVGNLDFCKTGAILDVTAFSQGPLLSCTFRIDPSAPAGTSPLTALRLNVGDPLGYTFGTASTSGSVTVLLPPAGTSTPTNTPTVTPTPQPTGQPCIAGSQCVSGNCVDSVCCGVPFCPAGMACNVSGKEGQCAVVPTPTPTVPQQLGAPCNSDGQCMSSHCTDGACCVSAQCPSGEFCNISGSAGNCAFPVPTATTPVPAAATPTATAAPLLATPTLTPLAISLSFVHLRASTRASSSTIRLQTVFDASPLGNLAQVLSGGGTVTVSGAGLQAPEMMMFPGISCFNLRSGIQCIGTKGEVANFKTHRASNLVTAKITAQHRSFPPPLTTAGVAVDLSLGGHLLEGQIGSCKVRGKGAIARCPK